MHPLAELLEKNEMWLMRRIRDYAFTNKVLEWTRRTSAARCTGGLWSGGAAIQLCNIQEDQRCFRTGIELVKRLYRI